MRGWPETRGQLIVVITETGRFCKVVKILIAGRVEFGRTDRGEAPSFGSSLSIFKK